MEEWTLLRQRLGWAGFIKLAMGETKTNPPAQSHQHEKRSRGGVVRAPQRAAAIYPPLSLSLSLLDAGLPSSELGTQTTRPFSASSHFPSHCRPFFCCGRRCGRDFSSPLFGVERLLLLLLLLYSLWELWRGGRARCGGWVAGRVRVVSVVDGLLDKIK